MNQATARSATRCTGGRDPCASSTSAMIWASTVSRPTRSAVKRNAPVPLIVPPTTASPAALRTGTGSPVIIDSST